MRVLITGGAGFIGSHLVDRHIAAGDDVIVVDDLSTGTVDNLRHHAGSVRLTLVEGRVEKEGLVERHVDGVGLIYHLAASVGVFEVLRRPLEAIRSNLTASDLIFEIAADRQIRTIFTSTSEVYGKNDADALRETDDSVFGATSLSRWLYGVSKAADEFLGLAYERERGLPITIVRLFNTTGPRQSGAYGMVVPRFVNQALAGEPITIFGDGNQTRCFTNVYDVIEAMVRLAATPESVGAVVNVGYPVEVAIRDLAELVREVCGRDVPIEHVDYRSAYGPGFEDMRRRVPDVARLRHLTGYVPSTPLETTVRQIVDVLRDASR
jgi:UDP-glucose 4-epimerase